MTCYAADLARVNQRPKPSRTADLSHPVSSDSAGGRPAAPQLRRSPPASTSAPGVRRDRDAHDGRPAAAAASLGLTVTLGATRRCDDDICLLAELTG